MNEKLLNSFIDGAKVSSSEIENILNSNKEDIADAIQNLVNTRVAESAAVAIKNDDNFFEGETITAMIEATVRPEGGTGFDKIAQKIGKYEEVKSVFLMSGGYDITIIIEANSLKQISQFVSEKLSVIALVNSTNTKLVLKKYKESGVILNRDQSDDERMIISP